MKFYLIALTLIITSSLNAQLQKKEAPQTQQIGVVKSGAYETVSLSKADVQGVDCYFFAFKNYKYSTIEEWETFHFCDEGGDLEFIYSEVAKGFGAKEPQSFEVADGSVSFYYQGYNTKFFFTNQAGIESESGWITKKNWAKLFGREYNKADFE